MLQPLYQRLRATDALIYEVPDGKALLADALWECCFPTSRHVELWHYTTLNSLGSILRHNEIWLHPVANRISEGELTEFASQFDYRGILEIQADGYRVADALAPDLFYLSLTNQEQAGDFWNYGEVRLRLRVAPIQSRSHLREMGYAAGDSHPLNILKRFARDRFNRHFLPWQISRNAAFFLDSYYSWESEVRLLIKRFDETSDLTIRKSGKHDVVAIPLGTSNDRVSIDLLHIEADTQSSLEAAQTLVAAYQHRVVPVGLYAG